MECIIISFFFSNCLICSFGQYFGWQISVVFSVFCFSCLSRLVFWLILICMVWLGIVLCRCCIQFSSSGLYRLILLLRLSRLWKLFGSGRLCCVVFQVCISWLVQLRKCLLLVVRCVFVWLCMNSWQLSCFLRFWMCVVMVVWVRCRCFVVVMKLLLWVIFRKVWVRLIFM